MNQAGAFIRLSEARHHDPFSLLGRHQQGTTTLVRAFLPRAQAVSIFEGERPLTRLGDSDLFEWRGHDTDLPRHHRLRWTDDAQCEQITHDP